MIVEDCLKFKHILFLVYIWGQEMIEHNDTISILIYYQVKTTKETYWVNC